tara:strand:- start:2734 stop:3618 length:885 start_codon:yes stop_codon:yes gene_type:complete
VFKQFISTLLLLIATQSVGLAQIDTVKSKLEIEKLGDQIYLFVQQTNIANPSSIVFVSSELSVVIDPGFEQMQSVIRDSIRALGGEEIEFVMATHFHTDHAQAIGGYLGNTTILLSSAQSKNSTETELTNALSSEETYVLKLTNEELQVHSMPQEAGHTGADAIFYFKRANVLVVGDYLFQDMYPIIDIEGKGSFDGYFKNVNYILNLADESTKIIPGHTSFKDPALKYLSKKSYLDYLSRLENSIELIKALKEQGLSAEDAIKKGLPDEFKDFNESPKYVSQDRWIRFIYNQL